tara:strand:- start:144 stop:881 length:738 start_codon:yes stop_codon:yes gene_type:complete
LEEFSEHIEYYKSLKKSTPDEIFWPIVIPPLVFVISWMIYDINSLNVTDLLQTPNLITITSFLLLLFHSHSSYSKRVNKAKEALDGNVIQLEKPRMLFDYLLTHLHPDDIEIGKIIHSEYSEKLEIGDLVLLRNATCTNYSSSTEEYYWEMPRENYGYGGMSRESDGYRYSGFEDRYYSGTSTRIIHKAELKIPTTKIIFSCSQQIKKGDVLTLIVELKIFDEESKIQHLTIKKILDHHNSQSEE